MFLAQMIDFEYQVEIALSLKYALISLKLHEVLTNRLYISMFCFAFYMSEMNYNM